MKKKLQELAELIGGSLEGPPTLEIKGVNSLEEAGPEDLSFVFDKKRFSDSQSSRARALVVPEDFPKTDKPIIRVKQPKNAMVRLLVIFEEKFSFPPGQHPTSVISPRSKIGPNVHIGPHCVVEDGAVLAEGAILIANVYVGKKSSIGAASRIHPGVIIYHNVSIGSKVSISSNSVIGSDGFGYVPEGKKLVKVPQIGRVVIEDNVEIGANTTIDRATMGVTRIGAGTKIDNQVQIAHNVKIGKNCLIAALTGISGSSELGDNVILAGQVGVAEHIKIGSDVIVTARAAVSKDLPAGLMVSGFPAQEFHQEMRQKAALRHVPELIEKIKKLEQKTKN